MPEVRLACIWSDVLGILLLCKSLGKRNAKYWQMTKDNIVVIFNSDMVYSNMTSFFRFANKPAIYLDGKISLAHVRCTHLSQVIKSQNNII